MEPALLIVALAVGGVAAGIAAGLLGVGGGIVVVPILYHAYCFLAFDSHIAMHLAVGTSLAVMVPTSIQSVARHYRRGAVDAVFLKDWGPAVSTGAVIGCLSAGVLSTTFLVWFFAAFAVLISVYMFFGTEQWAVHVEMPKPQLRTAIGLTIGAVASLMGIGGGVFAVPLLTLYGAPITKAVATAAGFGVFISIPGTVIFMLSGLTDARLPAYALGYVYLPAVAILIPATVVSVPLGVSLAHNLPHAVVRRCFAVFLAVTAISMVRGALATP